MKIGVVGGGQLGRMLGLAGLPLGFQFRFLEPTADCPAGALGEVIRAPYDDLDALERFARDLSFATYEFENVPAETAQWLADRLSLAPNPRALSIAQDRILEKTTFRDLGIPVQPFAAIATVGDIVAALRTVSLPAVLKTRRLGYDGKGQRVLQATSTDPDEFVRLAWEELGRVPCILEALVPFSAEVSMIAVRARRAGHGATIAFYPLIQNEHRSGILWKSQVPAPCDGDGRLATAAEQYVRALMESLDYIGAIAVEFFVTSAGLIANEMAPRVHNSGHWTIDGAVTSQFENHLRAIGGLSLGSTECRGASVMINLVGRAPITARLLALPHARLHLYGKSARAGRKVGHVTLTAPAAAELGEPTRMLEQLAVWEL
ncbi:MAG: 5-(carboxyamino)imidazole ribonucleotide synthase [Phycisphaerales bacterium]|nr:5-(carboxyamino)imidazole ribonucleotide synthase [Phycisphaerales bacterium]